MKLLSVTIKGGLRPCQNCGHDIKEKYTVESESGETLIVGSECVKTLTGKQGAAITKRVLRAARQWRDRKPAPLPDESREDYIERRVSEMANAMKAYEAHTLLRKQGNWLRYYNRLERTWRALCHVTREWVNTLPDGRPAAFGSRQYSAVLCYSRVDSHALKHIARRHKANPFDFNRPGWEVVKI
jgi:hypothetical protein